MKFSGFAFGTTSTTTSTTGTPATGGFSFGGAAAGTSAQKPPAFSGFGTPSSGQSTGGFSFGQPSQQQVCNFFLFCSQKLIIICSVHVLVTVCVIAVFVKWTRFQFLK